MKNPDSHTTNPMDVFKDWYEHYKKTQLDENVHNAMVVSTCSASGFPNSRVVLLKEIEAAGLVFYTNLSSTKSQELLNHPKASLCFNWHEISRQVRIKGVVEQVADEQADAYFATRPKISQIGAWASKQSHPCESWELEKRLQYYSTQFSLKTVPRPKFWGGFRIKPVEWEFWMKKKFRLHERYQFSQNSDLSQWQMQRLFP